MRERLVHPMRVRSIEWHSRRHVSIRVRALRGTGDVVLLARALRKSTDAVDERVVVRGATTLDVDVDTKCMRQPLHPPRSLAITRDHVPIENSRTEGTSAARPTEEQVPDSVTESSRLGSRAEACGASGATEGNRDDLALCLASLD